MSETNPPSVLKARIITADQLINNIENLYFVCVATVMLLLVSSLPLSKLCIGVIYLYQCPAQQQIPIWLIVSGCRGLFCIILLFLVAVYCNIMLHCYKKTLMWPPIGAGVTIGILFFFHFAWSIVGVVWSWSKRSIVQHDDISQIASYCHSVPYIFQTVAALFYLVVISLFFIIGCVCARLKTSKQSNRLDEQASNRSFNQSMLFVTFFVIFLICMT